MKTAAAFFSTLILLLAREAAAGPPAPRDLEACCCCVPGKNVVSCTNAIKPKDCVCLAVMCPKGAPTIWEKTKRPQATTTTTLTPDVGLGPGIAKYPLTADASILTAAPSPQAPLKDVIIGGGMAARAAAPTPRGEKEEREKEKEKEDEDEGEDEGQSKLAPCCCCDVRHASYTCQMRRPRDCFCGQVMCPSRAPTVWNDAEPTARMTQRIGTVW